MFKSFFPSPRYFFISAVIWIALNMVLWYSGGSTWGSFIGFHQGYHSEQLPIGVSRFWSPTFIWFYLWFLVSTAIFAGFWRIISNHPWQRWSVWGSAFILFNIWFGVQVSVAVNAWYAPFYNLIQAMLDHGGGDINKLYSGTVTFLLIAMVGVTLAVINAFFASHYVFR